MLQKTRLLRVWALEVPSVTGGTWLMTLLTTADRGLLELRWRSQVRKRGKIPLNQFVMYTNNLDKEHRECTVSLFLFRRPVKHSFHFLFYTAEIIVQKNSNFYLPLFNSLSKNLLLCTNNNGGRHFPPFAHPPPPQITPYPVTLLVW
jgi:hypothetical protein